MKKLLLLAALLFSLSAVAADADTLPASALYAFETSEGMKVGAAFGTLHGGDADDELLSVTSPLSPRIEIHEMKEVGGIMQMRKVTSMPIAKNADNALSATGYHLMIMDLSKPLTKGDEFPVTLTFKNAGVKTLIVPVISRKAK